MEEKYIQVSINKLERRKKKVGGGKKIPWNIPWNYGLPLLKLLGEVVETVMMDTIVLTSY